MEELCVLIEDMKRRDVVFEENGVLKLRQYFGWVVCGTKRTHYQFNYTSLDTASLTFFNNISIKGSHIDTHIFSPSSILPYKYDHARCADCGL